MTVPTLPGDPAAPPGPVADAVSDPVADAVAEPVDKRWLTRRRAGVAVVVAIAVLVPLALFTSRAMHAPVNFDGAMNLQVARRLAEGDGYTRVYGRLRQFPHEVQTNGPYMYLAAAAIRLLGPGQLAYQFANLAFIAGFGAVVSVALAREGVVARLTGPFLVLLAIPMIPLYGLGGLGEIPTTFFLLVAVLALARAVAAPERSPWWVLAASLAFGAAFTTKTFAAGAAGALAAGAACVLAAAPNRRVRWQVLLAGGGAGAVVVAREVYRLIELGSPGAYRAWWSEQGSGITAQSGLGSGGRANPVQTFLDHTHVLSQSVDYPAELLLVVLFLPVAWVGAVVVRRCRHRGVRWAVGDRETVTLLMLGLLAASYIGWWLLLVPEAKLWIRRMIPGLVALHLLYVLMVPRLAATLVAAWRRRRTPDARRPGARAVVGGGLAGVLAICLVVVPYGWRRIEGNTRATLDDPGHEAWLEANRAAADHIRDNPAFRYYGDNWWSAPVISLMSGTDFGDLSTTDACSLDPGRDRLVWDLDAKNIAGPEPPTHDGTIEFAETASFGGAVTLYAVGPSPGRCD